MTTVKEYLSKVTLATLFLLLNFFINELHLFAYNPSEVYSRVVGFLRPVKQWNDGKQEEFKARKLYKSELPATV